MIGSIVPECPFHHVDRAAADTTDEMKRPVLADAEHVTDIVAVINTQGFAEGHDRRVDFNIHPTSRGDRAAVEAEPVGGRRAGCNRQSRFVVDGVVHRHLSIGGDGTNAGQVAGG